MVPFAVVFSVYCLASTAVRNTQARPGIDYLPWNGVTYFPTLTHPRDRCTVFITYKNKNIVRENSVECGTVTRKL